jgi:D-sedoheptulose 7-phosphate isomerase
VDSLENKLIAEHLSRSLETLKIFVDDQDTHAMLRKFSDVIASAFERSNKLLIAGNGGSAGDAQHMAGEFVSRLFFDHAPLPAIALTTDTSVLTAIGNDYGYEKIFERQVSGLGFKGDIFLGISTSGKSRNVLRALETAKQCGLTTLGFAGANKGQMDDLCNHVLHAPSTDTATIQQIHGVSIHIICGLVEQRIFPRKA